MDNATPQQGSSSALLDRRSVLRRLTGTAAAVWVAPSVLSISRASAATGSGCSTITAFDDGSLQGWRVQGRGPASWQVTTQQSMSGNHSVWFGMAGSANSLFPTQGAPSYGNGRSSGTLTSPVTTATATDVISFDVRLAIESAAQYDVFRLFIVQGPQRQLLWDKSMGGFATGPHPEDTNAPWHLLHSGGGWTPQSITIGAPNGIDLAQPVHFEFDFQTVDRYYNRTEGIFLDNIMLPCAAPAMTAASDAVRSNNGVGIPGVPANDPNWVPPGLLNEPEPPREPPGRARK